MPRLDGRFLLPLLALSACGPPAIEGGFDSANPAARIYACEQAARSNNLAAIPEIVECLDSDDPAVRLVAIESLRSLTGRDNGYRVADPPELRAEAIETWIEEIRSGSGSGAGDQPRSSS